MKNESNEEIIIEHGDSVNLVERTLETAGGCITLTSLSVRAFRMGLDTAKASAIPTYAFERGEEAVICGFDSIVQQQGFVFLRGFQSLDHIAPKEYVRRRIDTANGRQWIQGMSVAAVLERTADVDQDAPILYFEQYGRYLGNVGPIWGMSIGENDVVVMFGPETVRALKAQHGDEGKRE